MATFIPCYRKEAESKSESRVVLEGFINVDHIVNIDNEDNFVIDGDIYYAVVPTNYDIIETTYVKFSDFEKAVKIEGENYR